MSNVAANLTGDLKALKLHYVDDKKPGITRKLGSKKYAYYTADGKLIKDAAEIARINKLAIPPAYKNVWICPAANGHMQATGIDARGRKQYRYHPDWRAMRDSNKFEHILSFGENLSAIRKKIDSDLRHQGLPKEKVLAAVVKLLEVTLIRVGNEQYAKDNQSYGLTTLKNKHVDVHGSKITFQFKGKSNKQWNLSVNDRRIAAVTKRCEEIPGHELFKWVDDNGVQHDITSTDVNNYLKEISDKEFSAKDFRTWAGTVLAAMALNEFEKFGSLNEGKKNVVKAIEKVAKQLGNTPAICRKCYIHPEIVNAYMDQELVNVIEEKIDKKLAKEFDSLKAEEIIVLTFLKKRLASK